MRKHTFEKKPKTLQALVPQKQLVYAPLDHVVHPTAEKQWLLASDIERGRIVADRFFFRGQSQSRRHPPRKLRRMCCVWWKQTDSTRGDLGRSCPAHLPKPVRMF
jgi:hypothetical protein